MITDPGADQLLDIAQRSIVAGLRGRSRTAPAPGELPPELRSHLGAFVTLTVAGELRGCIGEIEPTAPIGVTVAHLAWSAAFADTRFAPLREIDLPDLAIEVSLLSPLQPIAAGSRALVLHALEPGVHGLVLALGGRRALFLPDVWTQLPDGDTFVDHLLTKAGIDARRWPPRLQAWRFTTTAWTRQLREHT